MDGREARDIVMQTKRLLGEGEALVKDFREIAEVNDAFVSGRQFGGVTYKDNHAVIAKDDWFDDENIPRIFVNVLGNLVATLVSLITKNRPCAVARALNESDPDDIYDAEVANTVIRYLSQELNTVEVLQRAVKFAADHGTGFVKAWYDVEKKKAAICPVSIFNVTLDPNAENASEAQWFIFHRWLRIPEAKKLIANAGLQRGDPKDEEYKTAAGIKKRGVRAYEVWIKPGYLDDYPAGIYAFIVNDIVVDRADYPLVIQTDTGVEALSPLVAITSRPVEECIYGQTSVTHCVPLQRLLNETVSRMLKYLRIGSSPKLCYPNVFGDGFDPYTDAKLPFPASAEGIAAMGSIKWLEGPAIPKEAVDLREFAIKQMHDTLGVSQLTAGTQTRTVSGKALEEIEGLDAQKNSQTTRSIETATLDLYRLLLAIVQLFYPDGTKMQIAGTSGAEVMLFNRADIMGKDIRLEPASEFDLMQPNEEQVALERTQQGLGSAADLRATGRDPRTAYSRQLAERIVQEALAGADVQIGADDIDIDAFKEVIAKHKHLALLDGRRSDYMALVDLEKFVDELAAQQAQVAPPDQQQPPPAPAPALPQQPQQPQQPVQPVEGVPQ